MASDPSDLSIGSPADQQHEQDLASEDLVRSLRDETGYHPDTARLHRQAADTVERLERELIEARKDSERHYDWSPCPNCGGYTLLVRPDAIECSRCHHRHADIMLTRAAIDGAKERE